jgi:hypothetical protein
MIKAQVRTSSIVSNGLSLKLRILQLYLVLRVNKSQTKTWSEQEVVLRWKQLFKGHILVDRWLSDIKTTQAETDKALEFIALWRERLYDFRWYMRCLNESIAVRANKEDNCKVRFWERRLKSQALLDETALLACMAYVDLNPIRAAICDAPKYSDFTRVQSRINSIDTGTTIEQVQPNESLPFMGYALHGAPSFGIPFKLFDYLALVEWTGRCIRSDKLGFIPPDTKPLFERLNINEPDWLLVLKEFNRHFISAAGSQEHLTLWALNTNRRRCSTHGSLQLYLS